MNRSKDHIPGLGILGKILAALLMTIFLIPMMMISFLFLLVKDIMDLVTRSVFARWFPVLVCAIIAVIIFGF